MLLLLHHHTPTVVVVVVEGRNAATTPLPLLLVVIALRVLLMEDRIINRPTKIFFSNHVTIRFIKGIAQNGPLKVVRFGKMINYIHYHFAKYLIK